MIFRSNQRWIPVIGEWLNGPRFICNAGIKAASRSNGTANINASAVTGLPPTITAFTWSPSIVDTLSRRTFA